ncbi:MAG TPA: DUF3592 domain-containing protein [Thermomonospora sp.]|nr:DUF3592 domain-containing protein [Thermomonospora sp.]
MDWLVVARAIASVAFLGTGTALLVVAGRTFVTEVAFARRGVGVPGTVVGHREVLRSDDTFFVPVVRYETTDGRTVERDSARTSFAFDRPFLEEGARVTVLYRPDRPERHLIRELRGQRALGMAVALTVGAVLLMIGTSQLP